VVVEVVGGLIFHQHLVVRVGVVLVHLQQADQEHLTVEGEVVQVVHLELEDQV
jgi:hypothetical protein